MSQSAPPRSAYCPGCAGLLDPNAAACDACGAVFGPGSAWQPLSEPPKPSASALHSIGMLLLMAAYPLLALSLTSVLYVLYAGGARAVPYLLVFALVLVPVIVIGHWLVRAGRDRNP